MTTALIVSPKSINRQHISDYLNGCGYMTYNVNSIHQLRRFLETRDGGTDVIVGEMDSFGPEGYRLWMQLRKDKRWQKIPLVLVSGLNIVTEGSYFDSLEQKLMGLVVQIEQRLLWVEKLSQSSDMAGAYH